MWRNRSQPACTLGASRPLEVVTATRKPIVSTSWTSVPRLRDTVNTLSLRYKYLHLHQQTLLSSPKRHRRRDLSPSRKPAILLIDARTSSARTLGICLEICLVRDQTDRRGIYDRAGIKGAFQTHDANSQDCGPTNGDTRCLQTVGLLDGYGIANARIGSHHPLGLHSMPISAFS
jgi:hypothetical protein